jgi:ABC-type sugar transport system ATPase subunit
VIAVSDLSIRLGSFSLDRVSLQVPPGHYAVLMGRTGTGKTSILEAICGLRPIRSGQIRLAGRNVTGLKPAARGVGYVPQDGALFATMTVGEHLAFALRIRHWAAAAVRQRVRELAELLEIGHLLDRLPRGLSGGESQRVALGRALAFRPQTLLLDEPLSALDEDTRQHLYAVLRRIHVSQGVTALHVTHNRAEAEELADLVLRLERGHVVADSADSPSSRWPLAEIEAED